jgi:long-subunit acyl-CoA synthetase (AMP-forming)
VLAENLRDRVSDASFRDQITGEFEALLDLVNGQVEHHERLALIVVSTTEWTIANEMLTPTMKIRRQAIEDATEANVDGWYDAGTRVVWA